MTFYEVWDSRECVSHHSSDLDAHRSIVQARDLRTFTLYDPTGRIVAIYKDGRELVDGIDGSAFPKAG